MVAILSGPGALSRRIGGRLGRGVESIHRRLHPHEQPGPARVSIGVVSAIDDHVQLIVARSDLPVTRFEDWVRRRIIDRIPGASHAPE